MSKNEIEKIWNDEVDLPYKDKVEKLQSYFVSMANGKVEKPDFIESIETEDNCGKVVYPSWTEYKHIATDDLYVREINCPKDKIIFSVIHKKPNPLFLLSGKILISSEDGIKELTAPTYILTEPGIKRIILVLEDVKAVTVHPNITKTKDLDKIDNELFACNWNEFDEDASKDIWQVIK